MHDSKKSEIKVTESRIVGLGVNLTFALLQGCGSSDQATNAQPQANSTQQQTTSEQIAADKNQPTPPIQNTSTLSEPILGVQAMPAAQPTLALSQTNAKFKEYFPYVARPTAIVANDQMKQELQNAKNLWAIKGGERYQLTQSSQIGNEYYGPSGLRSYYKSNFAGNSIIDVTEYKGDDEYPIPSTYFTQTRVKSVNQLFALIEETYNSSEYTVSAEYNKSFGYPEYIYINYAPRGADGFAVFQSTNLTLKP